MKELARLYKALADETRLDLMALLLDTDELCVCDCMQVLDISQSRASRHLRYLANAGLLDDRREGTWVYYRLAQVMTVDRHQVVSSLRDVLPSQRREQLADRLADWLLSKGDAAGACGPQAMEEHS